MGDSEYLRCIEADAHGRRSLSSTDLAVVLLAIYLLALFAAFADGSMPQDTAVRDRVDLIEVNHFHDDQARLVFDQVIFWQWSPADGRHQVQAWRLLKSPDQKPRRDYRTGDYSSTWCDGETDREVRAATVRETWTQHDPELVERDVLPKERRRELSKK